MIFRGFFNILSVRHTWKVLDTYPGLRFGQHLHAQVGEKPYCVPTYVPRIRFIYNYWTIEEDNMLLLFGGWPAGHLISMIIKKLAFLFLSIECIIIINIVHGQHLQSYLGRRRLLLLLLSFSWGRDFKTFFITTGRIVPKGPFRVAANLLWPATT